MNAAAATAKIGLLLALATVLVEPGLLGRTWLRHGLRTVVLLWLLAAAGELFARGIVRNERVGGTLRNALSAAFALFVVLTLLEAIFTWVPRSHGVGYTLAAKNWFAYFWRTDDRGFRIGSTATPEEPAQVVVVGDSFTAGHGIRDPRDTFAGRLDAMLDGRFSVVNLGRNGAGTADELEVLRSYPEPDRVARVILQYFPNDIEGAAEGAGQGFSGFEPYAGMSPIVALPVRASHLLNFLYWLSPHSDTEPYLEFLVSAYEDPAVFDRHAEELGGVVRYAEERGVPLLVLLFPFLGDPELATPFLERVAQLFAAQGVPVVDVGDLVADLPVRARVVNSNDAHPSVEVHRRVAVALRDALEARAPGAR